MSRAGHWSNLPSLVRRRLLLPPYHYCRTFFDTKNYWLRRDPTPNEKVMRFYAQRARATGLFSFPSRRLRGAKGSLPLHSKFASCSALVTNGTGPAGTTDLPADAEEAKDAVGAVTRRSIMSRETGRLHCLTSRNEGSGLTQHNSGYHQSIDRVSNVHYCVCALSMTSGRDKVRWLGHQESMRP